MFGRKSESWKPPTVPEEPKHNGNVHGIRHGYQSLGGDLGDKEHAAAYLEASGSELADAGFETDWLLAFRSMTTDISPRVVSVAEAVLMQDFPARARVNEKLAALIVREFVEELRTQLLVVPATILEKDFRVILSEFLRRKGNL